MTVGAIDDRALTASVNIESRRHRQFVVGPAEVFGGVASDGGGFIILNGKIVRIPPRSPMLRVLEGLVALEDTNTPVLPTHLQHPLRVQILEGMSADLAAQLDELTELHTPIARDVAAREADARSGEDSVGGARGS